MVERKDGGNPTHGRDIYSQLIWIIAILELEIGQAGQRI